MVTGFAIHVAHCSCWKRSLWYSSHRLMGVRALPCGLDYDQFPLRLSCGDGFSDVLTAYGPLVSGSHFSLLSPEEYSYVDFSGRTFRKCSRILRYLVRQWILVASVYGLCLATETGTHSANCARTSPWRSHRCSSWTSLTWLLCSETGTFSAVCVQTVEIPQVPFLVVVHVKVVDTVVAQRHEPVAVH